MSCAPEADEEGPASRSGAARRRAYRRRMAARVRRTSRLGHCCRAATARPWPVPVPSRDGSHGHAVGPWRRAGVAVPHLALISLEAASRSSRRVKTVVSSHRYDPRNDSICETLCRSHRPTWAAPHGIFNVPPYDRATSRISTSVQYVYRRAPPASARAPAEPQGRPRDPHAAARRRPDGAGVEASRPSALRGLSPADRRGAGRGPAARPPGGRSRSAARIRTIESRRHVRRIWRVPLGPSQASPPCGSHAATSRRGAVRVDHQGS